MSAQGTNEIADIVWNHPNNNGVGQTSEMFLVVFGASSFTIKWKMTRALWHVIKHGLDWIGKTWTGLIKHGLIKHGLIKHALIRHGLIKHAVIKHGERWINKIK